MNVIGGRFVCIGEGRFSSVVATFQLKPHREVTFFKCPDAFKTIVLACVDEYAKATEAISILANLSTSSAANT